MLEQSKDIITSLNIPIVRPNYKISSIRPKGIEQNLFLANNFRLALKFKLKGLYLSANNKKISLSQNSLPKNFKIIGSAHNLKELNIKKIQKVDEIFLAPMFKKKNKFCDS